MESEGKFIEIVVHVPRIDRALVGAQKPALDPCGYAVNARQGLMRRDVRAQDDRGIVLVPLVLERGVNGRSVRAHRAAWGDVCLYKGHDAPMVGPAMR
jgi:hypothetical protein